MKKRFTLFSSALCFFLFLNTTVFAQIENAAYNATGRAGVGTTMLTDYQAIGVNPANIGIRYAETKNFTVGLFEGTGNVFLQGVKTSEINEFIQSGSNSDSLDYFQRLEGAKKFSGKAFGANVDVMPIGFAYNNDKIGSFAFNMKTSFRYFMDFNLNFTQFAFSSATALNLFPQLITGNQDTVANDPNQYQNYINNNGGIKAGYNKDGLSLGSILNNSSYKLHWTTEYALGYGRKIVSLDEQHALYAGVAVKFVQGFGYVDISAKNGRINGVASYMPSLTQLDSLLNIRTAEQANSYYKPVGQGLGFDIGVTAEVFHDIRVGASVVNIGSITYRDNVYNVSDTVFTTVDYNSDFLGGFDKIVKWERRGSVVVPLATQLRIGASAMFAERRIQVGVDYVQPLNNAAGNYNTAVWALGGDFFVLPWLRLSTGTSIGGNIASVSQGYSTRVAIPFGIGIVLGEDGGFEMGISTRDVSTYFIGQSSPLYSAAIGLVRLRF
ncbi:MAG: hypothetical protein K0R51_2090 [Cytophagaceae bacterium]|jgi:hypothetical protein|nr:hypothetical protein [Cytophagaceae bacterium]